MQNDDRDNRNREPASKSGTRREVDSEERVDDAQQNADQSSVHTELEAGDGMHSDLGQLIVGGDRALLHHHSEYILHRRSDPTPGHVRFVAHSYFGVPTDTRMSHGMEVAITL